jgi:hypothetical protein
MYRHCPKHAKVAGRAVRPAIILAILAVCTSPRAPMCAIRDFLRRSVGDGRGPESNALTVSTPRPVITEKRVI